MPEISVIVPVYKAEAFLADCIDSILSQSFSDFEIILVDDGSPDNSGRICDEYAAKYEHIHVLHQENQGQAAARNHALTHAQGQWICYVDSDDLIHPGMLEQLYHGVCSTGAPVAMCEMLEAVAPPESFYQDREISFEYLSMDEATLTKLYDAEEYPAWVACAKLIRRDLIESYPFREGRVYEDNEAVCHWLYKGGSLARSREMLYFYRGNPESTTKSEFRLKRLDYLWALESLIDFYTGLGYGGMRQRFIARYIDAVSNCCNGARYMLQRPDVVKQIEDSTRAFLRRQKIALNQEQFELLLDVMHPNWMKLYWPASAAARTIRQNGIFGLLKKLGKKMGKGDGQ